MSVVIQLPYTELAIPPSEAFPQGVKVDYPLIPVFLNYQGKGSSSWFLSIIDSGADNCVFPAIFGRQAGIPIEAGAKMPTIGATGAGWAYFHDVNISLDVRGSYYNFNCRAGFMPDLDLAGYGLLGRQGFFSLFEKVAFDSKARLVELTAAKINPPTPATAPAAP